jgi:O-methyltransferase
MNSRLKKLFASTNLHLIRMIKEMQFNSPLRRHRFPMYQYQFGPQQLCFLCHCIAQTKDVVGSIAEIGCEHGHTTIFLCHYLYDLRIEKDYLALDTFSGFVSEDINFEVTSRSKREVYGAFRDNKKKWFDGTMKQNNITRVRSIEADVNEYKLTTLAPLSFILLDVDLYRPTRKALPELYNALSPGGIIVVDDCNPENPSWDGAYQAYIEFMSEVGQSPEIVYEKLGIVKKRN